MGRLFFLLAILLLLIVILICITTIEDRREKIRLLEQEIYSLNLEQIKIVNSEARELNELLGEIIKRESRGNPKICNREYGCKAGMGLVGFISGTWNDTLKKMSLANVYLPDRCWQLIYLPISNTRTEIIFDAECNYLVGKWLLENEGIQHWEEWSGPYNIDSN